jgi:hypothetical protein
MKLIVMAVGVLFAPFSASAAQASISVAELRAMNARACPLATRLAERYGISFSGFKTAIPVSRPRDTAADGPFVEIRIPEPMFVSDGFHHVALVSRKTQKAWILRTGGFISVYEWYGPSTRKQAR